MPSTCCPVIPLPLCYKFSDVAEVSQSSYLLELESANGLLHQCRIEVVKK